MYETVTINTKTPSIPTLSEQLGLIIVGLMNRKDVKSVSVTKELMGLCLRIEEER
jgi:hypothetical protein